MKTKITTIIATCFSTLVLVTSSVYAQQNLTVTNAVISHVNTFNRLAVTGNVEVTLIQANKEDIVYADNSNGEVTVTQDGHMLTISPKNKGVAKVIVYLKDIYRIQGSETAIINTAGPLNVNYLQILLKDNATANLRTNNLGTYMVLAGNATLKLRGATDLQTMATGKNTKLFSARFAAKQIDFEPLPVFANGGKLADLK